MTFLYYAQPHNIARLTEELAQAPGLEHVYDSSLMDPVTGQMGAMRAVFSVASDEGVIMLQIPDEVDPSVVEAVLEAHDPSEDPPPLTKQDILQELLDSIDSSELDNDALQIMLLVQKEALRP